jgi:two-component system, cell cycle response regulator
MRMPVSAPSTAPTWLIRAWQAAAVGGVALFTAHTLLHGRLGFSHFFDRYWYNALILLAVASAVVRAVTTRSERSAWIAFAVGLCGWAIGELLYDFPYGGDPPFPSVADAFYLVFYPACYVGMLLLLKHRFSDFGRMLWLDGAMAAIAAAALGAAVLFEVVLRNTDGSTSVIVTNLAYPIGDILLLSGVVGVFTLTGWRPDRTWKLIGVALLATMVADAIFLLQAATDTYTEGTVLDVLWPSAVLLLAAALWQPARRVSNVALAGRPLLLTPVVCAAIGIAILSYDHFHRENLLAVSLAGATLIAVTLRLGVTFRENARILALMRVHAVTDALTGLGNRRQLVDDLAGALEDGEEAESRLLAIFDLDGFKLYNDSFGHPAGDALLARLAGALATTVEPRGMCYRLGGDEFCVLAGVPPEEADPFLEAAAAALSESGTGFTVTCSYGAVRLPDEALNPTDALRLADQRLYVQKRLRSGRQAPHEMLLQALYERAPSLREHVGEVAVTATRVGERLGLRGVELEELRLAARLHDVGKLAIPDAVLHKPGPLDVNEWAFIKEHTVMGERILVAASGWHGVATIVRATHERWDGAGYPDGLAGREIPLAARIIAVCDAYSAMTSRRSYRLPVGHAQALDELGRCAGTQFDPGVVEVFCTVADQVGGEQRRGAA